MTVFGDLGKTADLLNAIDMANDGRAKSLLNGHRKGAFFRRSVFATSRMLSDVGDPVSPSPMLLRDPATFLSAWIRADPFFESEEHVRKPYLVSKLILTNQRYE
jgi:hypothetical protein